MSESKRIERSHARSRSLMLGAVGVCALGALVTVAWSSGRIVVDRAKIKSLEIDELVGKRLRAGGPW